VNALKKPCQGSLTRENEQTVFLGNAWYTNIH
jgi:hypothetical protein